MGVSISNFSKIDPVEVTHTAVPGYTGRPEHPELLSLPAGFTYRLYRKMDNMQQSLRDLICDQDQAANQFRDTEAVLKPCVFLHLSHLHLHFFGARSHHIQMRWCTVSTDCTGAI